MNPERGLWRRVSFPPQGVLIMSVDIGGGGRWRRPYYQASSGWRPAMLLSDTQDSPPRRVTRSQTSVSGAEAGTPWSRAPFSTSTPAMLPPLFVLVLGPIR